MDWFDAKDYVEAQTSGTTGQPKIVKIDKQAMVNSALATGDFFELEPGNTALHCLPARFIAGKLMLVRSIILGLEMDLVSPNRITSYNVCYTKLLRIVKASLCVGFTFPGIMEEPGSFSGMRISPIPERGPEASKRMSLAILFKETANCFNAA